MTSSPIPHPAQEKKERIETAIVLAKNDRPRSLHERMMDHTIPGVSIAVINDYHLEWACGYGVRKRGEPEPIETETPFQACSISKALTAVAVLRLVEEGRLDLEADVNTFLKSWKVPANGSWQPKVTIRQVLSHTAGISVPWFAGYHRDQDIPTWREILNGEQPTNTPEIGVTAIPGLRFRYSGGGYCILQQLLMDVMNQPFPNLMRALVLDPLGMDHSTYEQPLPARWAKMAAVGHRKSGKPVAGDWYIYPELAAAGLWTTPSDLARFALELQCAREEKPHQLLSAQMMKELLTPQSPGDALGDMGLGVFVQGSGAGARFGHPGGNTGFTSRWVSLMHGGQGCILMINSDNGWSLQQELLSTIAQVYAWPELPSRENDESPTPEFAAVPNPYIGEYELQSDLTLAISRAGDQLFFQMPGQPPLKLMRQSDGVYFLANMDDTITFVRNGQGNVLALLLRQGTTETLALRRDSVG
jgi:CubicO group peptidase (beta-lactamase class C family)